VGRAWAGLSRLRVTLRRCKRAPRNQPYKSMRKAGNQEQQELYRAAREFPEACEERCRSAALDDRPKPGSEPIPLRKCMNEQTRPRLSVLPACHNVLLLFCEHDHDTGNACEIFADVNDCISANLGRVRPE